MVFQINMEIMNAHQIWFSHAIVNVDMILTKSVSWSDYYGCYDSLVNEIRHIFIYD